MSRAGATVGAAGRIKLAKMPGVPAEVNDMNVKVAKILLNLDKHHPPSVKLVEGDIRTYTISVMRWRSCTALIVLQVSNKGMRILSYLDTLVKHRGGGFGTDCDVVHPKSRKRWRPSCRS
jgi:hypothetical protein